MRKDILYQTKRPDDKPRKRCIQADGTFNPLIKKYLLAVIILVTMIYLAVKIYLMSGILWQPIFLY